MWKYYSGMKIIYEKCIHQLENWQEHETGGIDTMYSTSNCVGYKNSLELIQFAHVICQNWPIPIEHIIYSYRTGTVFDVYLSTLSPKEHTSMWIKDVYVCVDVLN